MHALSSPLRVASRPQPDPPDLAGDRRRLGRLRAALLRADEVRLPAHGADVPGAGRGDRGRHQAGRGARRPRRTQLLEQYKAQLAEARTEAARIRDEARADAEGIRQDVLAKAREESDRIIAAGRDAARRRAADHRARAARRGRHARGRPGRQDRRRVARRRGAPPGHRRAVPHRARDRAGRAAADGRRQAGSRTPPPSERLDAYAAAGQRPVHARRRSPTRSSSVAELLRRRAAAAPGAVRPVPHAARTGPSCSASLLAGKVGEDAGRPARDAGRRPLVAAGRAARRRPSGSASRRCSPAPTRPATWPRSRTSCSGSGRSSTATRRWPARSATPSRRPSSGPSWSAALLEGKAKPVTVRLVELALRGFGGRNFAGVADPAGRAGRRAARPRRSRT